MRFDDFNLQSWGYAAGLLASPFFFLFSNLFGETAGIFAAIVVAGCLLVARVNYEILRTPLGPVALAGWSILGLFISAFLGAQTVPMVIAEGVAFAICGWGLCTVIIKRADRNSE